jgi:hypothetical protein
VHAAGKVFQAAKDERQGVPLHHLVLQGFGLRFPRLDSLPEPSEPRLELRSVDQAFGIAVYQTSHAAAQLGKLHLDGREIEAVRITASRHLKPALVLRSNPGRVTQHPLDFLPHSCIQHVGAQRRVRTHA